MLGHFWTIVPHFTDSLRSFPSHGKPWSARVRDPKMGSIGISGVLDELPGANRLLIVVHGMGGNSEKSYVLRAAHHARSFGMSTLRLNLRGADERGEDIYHAGLVQDLQQAVCSPELAHYEHLHALGFSLGGHMVARYALSPDPRVRSVVALCSPLALEHACDYIDRTKQYVYRRHLLKGLRRSAGRMEQSRSIRLAKVPLHSISKIRDWDELVVAPRFGFSGASDYYRQVSVGRQLSNIAIPTLMIFAIGDPMVTGPAIAPALSTTNPNITVRQVHGGHVHLPSKSGALRGAVRWLSEQG